MLSHLKNAFVTAGGFRRPRSQRQIRSESDSHPALCLQEYLFMRNPLVKTGHWALPREGWTGPSPDPCRVPKHQTEELQKRGLRARIAARRSLPAQKIGCGVPLRNAAFFSCRGGAAPWPGAPSAVPRQNVVQIPAGHCHARRGSTRFSPLSAPRRVARQRYLLPGSPALRAHRAARLL